MFATRRLFRQYPHPRIIGMSKPTSRPRARLDQISKHLDSKPFLELNTPFSTERSARPEDDRGNIRRAQKPPSQEKKIEQQVKKAIPEPPKKMSNQPQHPALLIPGPIEFDDEVLNSMSHFRYDSLLPKCAALLTHLKRITCRRSLRRLLQRSPPESAQALPDHRPCIATLCHLRLRHTGLGSGCSQPGRAR
jgi:hypothetical protein